MNLEDFQAQFDEIMNKNLIMVNYLGHKEVYVMSEKDVEELYNLCLKALGEV